MSEFLEAALSFCQKKGEGLVSYCSRCLKEAGYDDMTETGHWCSGCKNQTDFTLIPTSLCKAWDRALKGGAVLEEAKVLLMEKMKRA